MRMLFWVSTRLGGKFFMLNKDCKGMDYEWVKLILEAIKMGIPESEIREFLSQNKKKTAELG